MLVNYLGASMVSSASNSVILNSWKEIANYLGRGVRTVQRWEHDLQLPVRRPRGKDRSAVLAMTDELDAWLHSAPTNQVGIPHNAERTPLLGTVRQSIVDGSEVRKQTKEFRRAHHEAVATLISTLRTMRYEITKSK